LSVCAGIEAASVAWHELGWTPVAFSEIENFPSAVLAHHYPNVPNWGDMTKFKEWPDESIDLLVGGTPCQSFSVAGLRKGLADPRGNLMLTYLAIADRYRPEWLVWENVPGVLSSNGGRDFGALLGGLAELGYGFAYRILDAQYFGVAQRRRRVFVVANARSWQRAAAVLFERESLCGNPAPSRKTREGFAQAVAGCLDRGVPAGRQRCDSSDNYIPVATYLGNAEGGAVDAPYLTCSNIEGHVNNQTPLVSESISFPWQMGGTIQMPVDEEITGALIKNQTYAIAQPIALSDTSSRHKTENGAGWKDDGTMYTLDTTGLQGVAQSVAPSLTASNDPSRSPQSSEVTQQVNAVYTATMQVRRLTPRECERLQGFPDDYTAIPYRNKPASDGPRYKALGNSMAVPVMAWIGKRIQMVEDLE
jgi:DNA (cytosine-5)-methyltransferase 1